MKMPMKMKVLFVFVIIVGVVVAEQLKSVRENDDETDLARKKSKYPLKFLGYGFGIYALGIIYWLKVKAIIIAFILGTAAVWGYNKFGHHFKHCPEIIHEGPIIPYDHGWHGHDHIGYSSHDTFDHDPYGGYHYSDPTPEAPDHDHHHHRRTSAKGRRMSTEDKVSEIVFTFLGVGSQACRKRFLCEMEFRAQGHPMTEMAFRVIGRGVFSKYIRNESEETVPRSFAECADVHKDCEFIEENVREDETNDDSNHDESEESPQTKMQTTPVPETNASATRKTPKPRSKTKKEKKVNSIAETILQRPSRH